MFSKFSIFSFPLKSCWLEIKVGQASALEIRREAGSEAEEILTQFVMLNAGSTAGRFVMNYRREIGSAVTGVIGGFLGGTFMHDSAFNIGSGSASVHNCDEPSGSNESSNRNNRFNQYARESNRQQAAFFSSNGDVCKDKQYAHVPVSLLKWMQSGKREETAAGDDNIAHVPISYLKYLQSLPKPPEETRHE